MIGSGDHAAFARSVRIARIEVPNVMVDHRLNAL